MPFLGWSLGATMLSGSESVVAPTSPLLRFLTQRLFLCYSEGRKINGGNAVKRKRVAFLWGFALFAGALVLITLLAISVADGDKLERAQAVSRQVTNLCFFAVGVMNIGYYFLCGKKAGFHQSGLKFWLVLGGVMVLRSVIVYFGFKQFGLAPYVPQVYFILHLFGLVLSLGFVAIETCVAVAALASCPEDTKTLIVLGAKSESPVLFARADTAAEWMQTHQAVTAVASGGQGKNETVSEAESILNRMKKQGIDASRVKLECTSRNTIENLKNSAALLPEPREKIALVTDDYHLFRARLIAFRELGVRVSGLAVHSSRVTLPHYMVREFFSSMLWELKQLKKGVKA